MNIVAKVTLAVTLFWAVIATVMYWRGVKQRNHLAFYVGLVLLDDVDFHEQGTPEGRIFHEHAPL